MRSRASPQTRRSASPAICSWRAAGRRFSPRCRNCLAPSRSCIAARANIVAFTTGRGTTIGNAIAPVFKIASNTKIFDQMRDDLDVNAGTILDGVESVGEVGRRILIEMVRIASGEKPALADEWRHHEFQIWTDDAIAL